MQVEDIISTELTEETKQKGHLSVRFKPDGFTMMVSDAGYKPLSLKSYRDKEIPGTSAVIDACAKALGDEELLGFGGETAFIVDNPLITLVPRSLLDETRAREYLGRVSDLRDQDQAGCRVLRDRHLFLLYGFSGDLEPLRQKMEGNVQILHAAECVVSLSDQIQASDHQRGFMLAEVQDRMLLILVIREDTVLLLNTYPLKDPSGFIYHCLNAFKQLDLDRENLPVYLTGMIHPDHELFGLMGKYIRNVKPTPYYLEELSRAEVLRHMVLAEGSKCA